MKLLRLPAKMESLEELSAFILECASAAGVQRLRLRDIDLVVEELLTNVIQYAYPEGGGDIEVHCFLESPGVFCVTIQDWGHAFDPLAKETPCTAVDVCERPVGGLGIHLVRHKADDVCYHRQGERNVLKVCFHLDR